ncbi:MAG: DUF427 domain-containing protein [bacterium]|nr:DUF427 domain-containing protein [bacterium]
MSEIESAWGRYPGYAIDLVPWSGRGRATFNGAIVAESDSCLIVKESDHQDQLYFPVGDVVWEHFTETELHTVCPFKGEADWWLLTRFTPWCDPLTPTPSSWAASPQPCDRGRGIPAFRPVRSHRFTG